MKASTRLACALAIAGGLICTAAPAQKAYPTKAVRFIVTYPPGGSSEVMGRIIGKQLTEYWGQQVIIETRPGAVMNGAAVPSWSEACCRSSTVRPVPTSPGSRASWPRCTERPSDSGASWS